MTKKEQAKHAQRARSVAAVKIAKTPEAFFHNAAGQVNVASGKHAWGADGTITDTGSNVGAVPDALPAATPVAVTPVVDTSDASAAATTSTPAASPAPCPCGAENHKMGLFLTGVLVGVVIALLFESRGKAE